MKRIALLITAVALICASADAQNLLKNLGNRAKNAVERNVGNKVEKGVNDVLDGKVGGKKDNQGTQNTQSTTQTSQPQGDTWTCPECGAKNTGKFCSQCGHKKPEAQAAANCWDCPECGHQGNTGKFCNECGAKKPVEGATAEVVPQKQVQTAYAKTDFVPGDEIIFDDPMDGEQLGEFPSMWELLKGESEVVEVNGKKAILLKDRNNSIYPLMKNPKNFLGDEFTVEFDWFWPNAPYDGYNTHFDLVFNAADSDDEIFRFEKRLDSGGLEWYWLTRDGKQKGKKDDVSLSAKEWHHIALSFNKRALKVYFDGVRQINLPNVSQVPGWFKLVLGNGWDVLYLTNFRIAQGAVPLYDRLASDGKIITYAITFDTGKATLKPEADVEINRIKGLMDNDPSLKFEVQGHCDKTGSDAVNDPLSQKRAEAIVARLVEMGIAKDRLTAVGKGSHEPIADNSTDEGRAKNRRVEFVKIN